MSLKLYLSIRPHAGSAVENAQLSGNYVVNLRADTPESCLASAAYDSLLRFFDVENSEHFKVTTRDAHGHIVLDTALPAIGEMASFGLSATRLE
ncbi:MAG: hypothetical protein ACI89D_000386 [Bermanella sp.]|jgi:hypothetical protein